MSRLWAVTSFFNPVHFRRKAENYRIFRERLGVPLVTVELAHDGPFELSPHDADLLIQLRGGDVMWQKERLLNLAISRLPSECDSVAWLDCDVVFERDDWASAALRELERDPVCQLYRTVYHMAPDTPAGKIGVEASILQHDSIGYASALGVVTSAAAVTDGVPGTYKRGHAWCGRRDILAEHGLYDRSIIGGGDLMIAFAALDQVEDVIEASRASPAHAEDYRRWAARFHRDVNGIGCLEGGVFHLWHGDLMRRQYTPRAQILRDFDYDPVSDITLDESGCWRWNSPKWEMHRRVREYFQQRCEDGDSPVLTTAP